MPRQRIPLIVALILCASALPAQLFNLPQSLWGEIEHADRKGIGQVELAAGALIVLAGSLLLVAGVLIHKLLLTARWRRAVDDLVGLERGVERLVGVLSLITFFMAPAAGLVGILIGVRYTVFGVALDLVATAATIAVIVVGALTLVLVSKLRVGLEVEQGQPPLS